MWTWGKRSKEHQNPETGMHCGAMGLFWGQMDSHCGSPTLMYRPAPKGKSEIQNSVIEHRAYCHLCQKHTCFYEPRISLGGRHESCSRIASGGGVEEWGIRGHKQKKYLAFCIHNFVLLKSFTFFADAFKCLIRKTNFNLFKAHTMCCKWAGG